MLNRAAERFESSAFNDAKLAVLDSFKSQSKYLYSMRIECCLHMNRFPDEIWAFPVSSVESEGSRTVSGAET